MKKIIVNLSTLLIFALLVTGCKKEGPQGPQGPAGTNGTNGTNGANITSNTYTVNSWSAGPNIFWTNINVPSLTSSVLSSGTVQVFMSADAGITWIAVPFVTANNYAMNYEISVNNVRLNWVYNGSGTAYDPYSIYGGSLQFRIVTIPA